MARQAKVADEIAGEVGDKPPFDLANELLLIIAAIWRQK